MEEKKQNVAAVVVTFNRLELLKKCIQSLREQTRKLDGIIVVNNNSTDGTLDWLNSQDDLTVITQENSGSAGGQYTGIKTAYEKGYDWILTFEDELRAEPNLIQMLVENINRKIAGIACVRINQDTKNYVLSDIIKFNEKAIKDSKRYQKITESSLNSNSIKIFAASFEGLLLNRLAIQKIGLPKKEFFIWYDDIEYCRRLNRFGPIYLIPSAKIFKISNNDERSFINSHYAKMLYGLRNYTYLENRFNPSSKRYTLIKYLSIFLKFLNIHRFYVLNFNEINIKIIKHFNLSVKAVSDGVKGKFCRYSLGVISSE